MRHCFVPLLLLPLFGSRRQRRNYSPVGRAAGLLAALPLALPALVGAADYGCLENSRVSCLQGGRFQLSAAAIDTTSGVRIQARIRQAHLGDAASLFYFFTFDNPELMVKVVDGCAINGRYWVFGSAATDLNYLVTVVDIAAGRRMAYHRNRSNSLIGDVESFPCSKGESVRPAELLGEAHAASAGAGLSPDLPVCGGAVVPDHLLDLATVVSREGQAPATVKRASTDKIHLIDIAFIYSSSITDRGKLMRNVDAAVAWANVAFLRSGVPAALRTVAVQPDRRYDISLEGVGLRDAMHQTRGVLAKVRSDNGADLVYALTNTNPPRGCGLAFIRGRGSSPQHAASYPIGAIWNGTDNDGCLGSRRVLAHEVGHNLGLVHGASDPDSRSGFRDDGQGFAGENANGRFYSTIMATRGAGFSRFSVHPEHYDGLPMGDETANASDALLYTIEDASNYSPTKVRDPAPDYECAGSPTRACMQNGRFGVEARVSYVDPSGARVNDASASTRDVLLGDTASLFHFFDESNPELLVKVLDGCGVNGKYWVFGSAATDLDWSLLVTDNATGVTLPYRRNSRNPLINDAAAFPCHP